MSLVFFVKVRHKNDSSKICLHCIVNHEIKSELKLTAAVFYMVASILQGDQKKHANWLFLGEIIQPNLPKFAYNLIRGQQVRIQSPI